MNEWMMTQSAQFTTCEKVVFSFPCCKIIQHELKAVNVQYCNSQLGRSWAKRKICQSHSRWSFFIGNGSTDDQPRSQGLSLPAPARLEMDRKYTWPKTPPFEVTDCPTTWQDCGRISKKGSTPNSRPTGRSIERPWEWGCFIFQRRQTFQYDCFYWLLEDPYFRLRVNVRPELRSKMLSTKLCLRHYLDIGSYQQTNNETRESIFPLFI